MFRRTEIRCSFLPRCRDYKSSQYAAPTKPAFIIKHTQVRFSGAKIESSAEYRVARCRIASFVIYEA